MGRGRQIEFPNSGLPMSNIKFSFIAGSNQEFMHRVGKIINNHSLSELVHETAQSPKVRVLEVQVKLVHISKSDNSDHFIDIYV